MKSDAANETVLDVTGLMCPLPVLRANKVLRSLPGGAILTIHATDPAAPADFVGFCTTTGHALIESTTADGVFVVRIRKAG